MPVGQFIFDNAVGLSVLSLKPLPSQSAWFVDMSYHTGKLDYRCPLYLLSNEGATSFGDEYTLCHLMSEQSASKMEIVALVILELVLSVP